MTDRGLTTRVRGAVALTIVVWLALAPAAGSHGGGAQAGKGGTVDPLPEAGEVATLGEDHARAHARLRGLERIAR